MTTTKNTQRNPPKKHPTQRLDVFWTLFIYPQFAYKFFPTTLTFLGERNNCFTLVVLSNGLVFIIISFNLSIMPSFIPPHPFVLQAIFHSLTIQFSLLISYIYITWLNCQLSNLSMSSAISYPRRKRTKDWSGIFQCDHYSKGVFFYVLWMLY